MEDFGLSRCGLDDIVDRREEEYEFYRAVYV